MHLIYMQNIQSSNEYGLVISQVRRYLLLAPAVRTATCGLRCMISLGTKL